MTVADGKPLRIWHVDVTPNAGQLDGIAVAVAELARCQRQLGHEVTVIRDAPPSLNGHRSQQPDIVHMHSVFRPAHAKLAYRLNRAGIPYVTSPHSGLAPDALRRESVRKRVYIDLAEKKLLTHAAAIICLTLTEAEEVRAVAGSAVPLTVVPNIAPEITHGYPEWVPSTGRPNLVCLSRFDVWQKGLDQLAAVAAWMPELDVTVYGAADHNQPSRLHQLQQSAPSNFRFANPVRGVEKVQVLASASLYIQTSRWEGLSMSVIEAMKAGVPCAVSPYIAKSMGLTDDSAALTLYPDAENAATQIRSALLDRHRLEAMGKTARDHVSATYAGHIVAALSVDTYRTAIAAPRHIGRLSERLARRVAAGTQTGH